MEYSSKPSTVLHEFRCRLDPRRTAFLLVVVSVGILSCLYLAIYPREEQVKDFGMTTGQFQLLMGAGAVLATCGLVNLARELLAGMSADSRIALTEDAVILPGPDWWGNVSARREAIEIPYDDIVSVKVSAVLGKNIKRQKQTRHQEEAKLQLVHAGGKISIPSNMLPSRQEFDRLSRMLTAMVESRQAADMA